MKKSVLIGLAIFLILGILGVILAEEIKRSVELSEGKNLINFSQEFSPIYVEDLVKLYPEITAVTSFRNSEEGAGYVNVFGGIGENFVIYPNSVYEIVTKQKTTLDLK